MATDPGILSVAARETRAAWWAGFRRAPTYESAAAQAEALVNGMRLYADAAPFLAGEGRLFAAAFHTDPIEGGAARLTAVVRYAGPAPFRARLGAALLGWWCDQRIHPAGNLVPREEEGGLRYYLGTVAVHCGDGLEVRMPDDNWMRVRFETDPARGGCPIFYFTLGAEWERPFGAGSSETSEGRAAGEWWVWDRRRDVRATCAEMRADEPDRHVYPDLERDSFGSMWAAQRAAEGMNAIHGAAPQACFTAPGGAIFRWPVRA